MRTLLEQFKRIKAHTIFEVDDHIFHIEASEKGIEAGECTNLGFISMDRENLTVFWDDTFSLDEHLQELYEKCLEHTLNEEQ